MAHTMTAVGNAQISTAQSEFGGASGLFDGTGDYVSTPDSADFAFGTGNFTIDFWIRLSATGAHLVVGQKDSASQFWGVYVKTTSTDNICVGSITGGTWDTNISVSATININTWYHIAVVRNGTTSSDWYLFLNGVQGTNTLNVGNYNGTMLDSTNQLQVGSLGGTLAADYNGYMDELRISKGVARWTANFTPPVAAYTSDANTVLLLHMDGTNGSTTFTDSSSAAYTLTCDQGSYVLTGQALSLTKSLTTLLSYGIYGLTGYALTFSKTSVPYATQSKNATSWALTSRSNTSWSQSSKNSSSWATQNKS